ncbi:MAG: hypothetical protein HMLKMBBP_03800 [Planctomycetes bacterium]|nr:hypothetical protein [Planctomycetota bacterium]
MASCPKCRATVDESARFCLKCGAPAQAGVRARPGRWSVTDLAARKTAKYIAAARTSVMVVAVLSALGAWLFSDAVDHLEARHMLTGPSLDDLIDQTERALADAAEGDRISTLRVIARIQWGIVAAYVGLWFWLRRNPFAASVTAAAIFVVVELAAALVHPPKLGMLLLLKLLILAGLVNGVAAGLMLRKVEAHERADA